MLANIDLEEIDYSVNIVREIQKKMMGLPANYFGNAVSSAGLIKKYTAFKEESVFSLVKNLRQAVNALDLNKTCQGLKQHLEYINRKNFAGEKQPDEYIENIIILNNYTKIPVYQMDFGNDPRVWAEPLADLVERPPFNARLIKLTPIG